MLVSMLIVGHLMAQPDPSTNILTILNSLQGVILHHIADSMSNHAVNQLDLLTM